MHKAINIFVFVGFLYLFVMYVGNECLLVCDIMIIDCFGFCFQGEKTKDR